MEETVKEKIAKIYALVDRGEPGERIAAKRALDRLMKRHNLSSDEIESIKSKRYKFKYSTELDKKLFTTLFQYLFPGHDFSGMLNTNGVREIVMPFAYLDYILFSTAYEYFKIHMTKEYKKIVLPQLKKCRKAKTKNALRAELQTLFFSSYVIASKLYQPGDLKEVDVSKMSDKEYRARMLMESVEGGNYKTPISTGLYLDQ